MAEPTLSSTQQIDNTGVAFQMAVRKPEDFPTKPPRYGALETSVLVAVYTLHSEGYKFQGTANIGGVLFS